MNRRCVGARSIGREGRPDKQGTSEVVSRAACFVGDVENRQITVRPDAEAILKAWPPWAKVPSAADLADCVVVLVGSS